jgi:hypothetical protein
MANYPDITLDIVRSLLEKRLILMAVNQWKDPILVYVPLLLLMPPF